MNFFLSYFPSIQIFKPYMIVFPPSFLGTILLRYRCVCFAFLLFFKGALALILSNNDAVTLLFYFFFLRQIVSYKYRCGQFALLELKLPVIAPNSVLLLIVLNNKGVIRFFPHCRDKLNMLPLFFCCYFVLTKC